ncbi:hypothetical protein Tco_0925559 [Tanacetum coccineum]|uniref:Uncharacterized protein n=1 Tax=Tanacetum coccineum TaxID=301880 RepID=A0ABQ5D8E5_9ASTR
MVIDTPYSIDLNTPYGSSKGRKFDTSYPTGGYAVSGGLPEQGANTQYLLCWIWRMYSEISNLEISSFKLQNVRLLACNLLGINDAIKVTLFDVINELPNLEEENIGVQLSSPIYVDVLIGDLPGFKTYEEYKARGSMNGTRKYHGLRKNLDHAGVTNDNAIQADQEWFDERRPIEDNDDIGYLDDYLIRSFIAQDLLDLI